MKRRMSLYEKKKKDHVIRQLFIYLIQIEFYSSLWIKIIIDLNTLYEIIKLNNHYLPTIAHIVWLFWRSWYIIYKLIQDGHYII